MNPLLDAFFAAIINGVAFTLWAVIALVFLVLILSILRNNDDDDDDGGTFQPMYEGNK